MSESYWHHNQARGIRVANSCTEPTATSNSLTRRRSPDAFVVLPYFECRLDRLFELMTDPYWFRFSSTDAKALPDA